MNQLIEIKRNYAHINKYDVLFGCVIVPEVESEYKVRRIIEVKNRRLFKDKITVEEQTFFEFK